MKLGQVLYLCPIPGVSVQSRTFICILVLQMFRQSVGLTLLRPLTNTVTTCPWTSVSVASQGCPPPRPHSPPPLQPPPPRFFSLSPQPSDQGKVSLSILHPKKKKPKNLSLAWIKSTPKSHHLMLLGKICYDGFHFIPPVILR